MSTLPSSVTVIMRSKNAESTLAQALSGLFSQEFKNFDLLVVDSGSTDGTLDILAQYPCRVLRIEAKSYFPGAVLNRAIEQAQGEIVVLQNSDAVPLTPRALTRLLEAFDDPNVAAAFARQVPRPDARLEVRHDYALSFPDTPPAPPWIKLSLPLAALRKSVWREHPFYTDAWASEDTEWGHWAMSKGYTLKYVPEALVMHSHNYTLEQMYGRRFVEGEADAFIYGGTESIGKMLIKTASAMARDFVVHLKHGAFREMAMIVPRCITWGRAYYKGHKLGEHRIASGNKDASIGQATVLERHDAK